MESIFPSQNGMKLEICNRRTLKKFTNVEIKQQTPKQPIKRKRNHKENFKYFEIDNRQKTTQMSIN